MFQPDENTSFSSLNDQLKEDHNYLIQTNDFLELQVFTQNGEILIDPDFVLTSANQDPGNVRPQLKYLVRDNGYCRLPLVGDVKLAGLTLTEAELMLQNEFKSYYKEPYVNLTYVNKRVIVLGGSLSGEVIPLVNENTKVSEVLAISKSVDNESKAQNIRLLRGEEVFLIDFSTIEGYRRGDIVVQTGDIIYVEPIRRPFNEFIRDNGPAISVVTSLLSLVVVLISVN